MNKIILFLVTFLIWSILSWIPDSQHLLIGVLVSFLVTVVTGDLFTGRPAVLKNPARYFYFLFYYLPVFLWECFKANIDVACRVINPALPIKPGIVKVNTKLKSDVGLTFLANSITLTPGTLSVDIDKEKGVLYVHWIYTKATDVTGATEIIVRRFEKILEKIFE
ncbi:MAG: Na+/H+ antiporter subunit E [Candidatus Omnitrophota bacterium]